LSAALGPPVFGLPYRLGKIGYRHPVPGNAGELSGRVEDGGSKGAFAYEAALPSQGERSPCEPGTLDEWLMERYTAFTFASGKARLFRVWHPPWMRVAVEAQVFDQSLLEMNWPFFMEARLAGAAFSSDQRNVWMGRPHRA
jgi:hypothetical protein